ncbi:hypothetical protein [Undibacterium squillarum]|nr:hypothetical protein [Undibacterium squillarum]
MIVSVDPVSGIVRGIPVTCASSAVFDEGLQMHCNRHHALPVTAGRPDFILAVAITMQKPAFIQKAMPRKARAIADDKGVS